MIRVRRIGGEGNKPKNQGLENTKGSRSPRIRVWRRGRQQVQESGFGEY